MPLPVRKQRKRKPVGDFRLRIQDSVERDICRQFDALFVCIFITDLENQWEERGSSQDWTAKNRQALVREIPLFVDQEFGRDLLVQCLPILSACMRTTYLIYESGHRRDACLEESGLCRSEVVSILNQVVRDYIVDNCFGVEVIDRVSRPGPHTLAGTRVPVRPLY